MAMPAYVIYEADVYDQDRYDAYRAEAGTSVVAAGGRYLARGGNVQVLEGPPPLERTVLLEFRTMQLALEWYRSQEYSRIRTMRESAAHARLYVVEGVQ